METVKLLFIIKSLLCLFEDRHQHQYEGFTVYGAQILLGWIKLCCFLCCLELETFCWKGFLLWRKTAPFFSELPHLFLTLLYSIFCTQYSEVFFFKNTAQPFLVGQNFHICLRSGPRGLIPPPLRSAWPWKDRCFFDDFPYKRSGIWVDPVF